MGDTTIYALHGGQASLDALPVAVLLVAGACRLSLAAWGKTCAWCEGATGICMDECPCCCFPNEKSLQVVELAGMCVSGGRGGIRTRGRLLTYTRFPGVRLKPLIHPSEDRYSNQNFARFSAWCAIYQRQPAINCCSCLVAPHAWPRQSGPKLPRYCWARSA